MKTASLLSWLVLPLGLWAGEVKLGDKVEHVQAALGAPRGRIQADTRLVLTYDRGEIVLVDGVVTRVALRSDQAQALFEAGRAADTVRLRDEVENRRALQKAEGEAIKATQLADKSFLSSPARTQVEFWRIFSAQYPMVSCAAPMNLARAQLYAQEQADRIKAEEEQRLAALKEQKASQSVFYPIYSSDSWAYDSRYRDRYRQARLDHDYFERINGRSQHAASLLCNPGNRNSEVPPAKPLGSPLLAAGQDAMAWDGTKMPGGEAAGSFR